MHFLYMDIRLLLLNLSPLCYNSVEKPSVQTHIQLG
jgi:hypothetical protein